MRYLFTLTLLFAGLPAGAASIQLEQAGWPDGTGPLRISFNGEDSDRDGALVVAEITDLTALWQTPAGVETAWYLSDVEPDGFVFRGAGDYLLFTRNARFSLVSSAFEGETLSSVFDEFLFPVGSSTQPAAAIPEPATVMLLAAGAAALAASRIMRAFHTPSHRR